MLPRKKDMESPPPFAEGSPKFWVPLVAGLQGLATIPLIRGYGWGHIPHTPISPRRGLWESPPSFAEGSPRFWVPLVGGLRELATRPLFQPPRRGTPRTPREGVQPPPPPRRKLMKLPAFEKLEGLVPGGPRFHLCIWAERAGKSGAGAFERIAPGRQITTNFPVPPSSGMRPDRYNALESFRTLLYNLGGTRSDGDKGGKFRSESPGKR